MKTLFFFIAFLFYTGTIVNAQTIENKVDDMTGKVTTTTKFETFTANMSKSISYSFYKYSENDIVIFLKIYLIGSQKFTIYENDELWLKLDNDELIKLKSISTKISTWNGTTGLGSAENINMAYIGLTETDINQLLEHKVVKYRIYTSKGKVEDDLKAKRADTFQKALQLIINTEISEAKVIEDNF